MVYGTHGLTNGLTNGLTSFYHGLPFREIIYDHVSCVLILRMSWKQYMRVCDFLRFTSF